MKPSFAHVTNPVKVEGKSDLYAAQPITFASMKRAQHFAAQQGITVTLYSAHYEEDDGFVPEGFVKLPFLQQEVGQFCDYNIRKLPILSEIMSLTYDHCSENYLIYTNVDIALHPDFYVRVAEKIQQGNDALSILRRDIIQSSTPNVEQLESLYQTAGKRHPGHDCLIFLTESYPRMKLGKICVGIPFIGLSLLVNIMAHHKNFAIIRGGEITFHLGEDRIWKNDTHRSATKFNIAECKKNLNQLIFTPHIHHRWKIIQARISDPLVPKCLKVMAKICRFIIEKLGLNYTFFEK